MKTTCDVRSEKHVSLKCPVFRVTRGEYSQVKACNALSGERNNL